MAKVMFVSVSAPSLKISMRDSTIRFEHGALELDDEKPLEADQIKELRESIIERPNIRQLVREVNKDFGRRVVEEHQKKLNAKMGAFSGQLSAGAVRAKAAMELAESESQRLQTRGLDAETAETLVKEIAENDQSILEPAAGKIVRGGEGFIPAHELAQAAQLPAVEQVKTPVSAFLAAKKG